MEETNANPGHRFIEAAMEMTNAVSCSFTDGSIVRVGGIGLVLGTPITCPPPTCFALSLLVDSGRR